LNITFVHADKPWEWNSAHWRCVVPAKAINRTNKHSAKLLGITQFAENAYEAEYACDDADVIVLQRGAMPDVWGPVRRWRNEGKVVIADIDDGYPQITAEHPAYRFWHVGEVMVDGQLRRLPRPAIHDMADGLRMLGLMTSPSRLILEDWRQAVGVNGAHVPNFLNLEVYNAKRTRTREDDGTIWVAWGGSAGHFGSFLGSGIADALCRVLASRPQTRFVMCGADTRILDRVPLKHHQKLHFNWRHFSEWPKILANFDVGLIPLAGAFDDRRSNLKPLEYSAMRVPWIATRSPAYAGLEELGTFVDNSPEAWADALIDAIDHAADDKRVRRAHDWAMTQGIQANAKRIVETYAQLGQKVTA